MRFVEFAGLCSDGGGVIKFPVKVYRKVLGFGGYRR